MTKSLENVKATLTAIDIMAHRDPESDCPCVCDELKSLDEAGKIGLPAVSAKVVDGTVIEALTAEGIVFEALDCTVQGPVCLGDYFRHVSATSADHPLIVIPDSWGCVIQQGDIHTDMLKVKILLERRR